METPKPPKPTEPKLNLLESVGISLTEQTETGLADQIPWETFRLIEAALARSGDFEDMIFRLKQIFEQVDPENGSKVLLIILRDIFTIGLARVAVLKQEREQQDNGIIE